ncbi:MAG: hypothetical protein JW913_16965 [Chitinispirillaceae bacterium]|nr:hypothetical protein [Chitinispirillaceae bacterium]
MGLSKEEIVDLALRYIPSKEVSDFPYDGDLFCLLIRQPPADRVPAEEEGWGFSGYGVCIGYSRDEEAKPPGKWLWMHFASLSSFPPVAQVLRLQPPHVIKGRFQSADRTHEIRIVKVTFTASDKAAPARRGKGTKTVAPPKRKRAPSASESARNIVVFRKKGTS